MIAMANATLVSIAPKSTPTNGGDRVAGVAVACGDRVRCNAPTSRQVYTLGATIKDASTVLYAPIARAASIVTGAVIVLQLDGVAAETMQVVYVRPRVKSGGLSHVEAFARRT